MKRKVLVIAVQLVLLCTICTISPAKESSISNNKKEVFSADHSERTIFEIVDETSELLLLDWDNSDLRKHLRNLAEDTRLSGLYRIYLYQFEDIFRRIDLIRNKIEKKEVQNIDMRIKILQSGIKAKDLEEKMNLFDVEKNNQYANKTQYFGATSVDPIVVLNKNLLLELESFNREFVALKRKQKRLEYIYRNVKDAKYIEENNFRPIQRIYMGSTDIERIKPVITIVKDQEPNVSDKEFKIKLLRGEVMRAEKKYREIERSLKDRVFQIKTLQNQVIDISLLAVERKQILDKRDREIKRFRLDFEELIGRLDLSKEIIQERNKEILILKAQVHELVTKGKDVALVQSQLLSVEKIKVKELELIRKDMQVSLKKAEEETKAFKKLLRKEEKEGKRVVSKTKKDVAIRFKEQIEVFRGEIRKLNVKKVKNEKILKNKYSLLEKEHLKVEGQMMDLEKKLEISLKNNKTLKQQFKRKYVDWRKLQIMQKDLKNVRQGLKDAQTVILLSKKGYEKKERKTIELEKKHERLKKYLYKVKKRSEIKSEKIDSLKRQIASRKSSKGRQKFKRYIDKKDREIEELEGVLGIYREKLKKASFSLKDNVASIVTLEEQITLVQTDLFEQDEILEEAKRRIKELEKKIQGMQKNFSQIKRDEEDLGGLKKDRGFRSQEGMDGLNDFLEDRLEYGENFLPNIIKSDIENLRLQLESSN